MCPIDSTMSTAEWPRTARLPRGSACLAPAVALSLTLGCSDGDSTAPAAAPPMPARHGITTFEDIDPDPNVVEVHLTASHEHEWQLGDGTSVHGLSYNGVNPGPLLEAKLGDRIVVHFQNDLRWPTTLHWHGLRVPAAMDGSMLVQDAIPPGGTFDYEFEARDVGLYWYHPHMHEAAQIDLGLYGPILIHGPGEPHASLSLDQPLIIDDMLLGDDGQIVGLDPHADEAHDTNPDAEGDDRLGNVVLANGTKNPTIPVTRGGWALFRLLNTSDARHLMVALEGHSMWVVGLDGGFLPEPYQAESILMGVGERYLVLVELTGDKGASYAWINTRYAQEDPFATDPLVEDSGPVATLVYGEDEVASAARPTFPSDDAPDMGMGGDVAHTWELGDVFIDGDFYNSIDGQVWPNIPVLTYPANGDYTFVIETSDDPHPFHLHGNSFQVVAIDDQPVDLRAWKDTVTVEPESRIRIRTRLDNPGRWMYHCHILNHQEEGMMAELVVVE